MNLKVEILLLKKEILELPMNDVWITNIHLCFDKWSVLFSVYWLTVDVDEHTFVRALFEFVLEDYVVVFFNFYWLLYPLILIICDFRGEAVGYWDVQSSYRMKFPELGCIFSTQHQFL